MSKHQLQNLTIGRYENDPEAQGCIRPEDGRWQLVIDCDGYPHLYVEVHADPEEPGGPPLKGLMALDDLLIPDVTVRDLMDGGSFGGRLTPEQEAEAVREYEASRAACPVPCPR